MIRINGREINLDSLRVKVERRRARGMLRGEEWPARSLKEELLRLPELEPRSYFGVQYRLQRTLALHGARLEPPLRPAGGFLARLPGMSRLGMLAAKVRRRAVTAPNEGYVGQQEQFNSRIIAALEAVSRIYHEMLWEEEGRLSRSSSRSGRLEPLDEAAVEGLMGVVPGRMAFIGLPGTACMERLLERGRLEMGIDPDDRAVAEYQAAFLPARWQRPEELLESGWPEGAGGLVLNTADLLTWRELDGLLARAASSGRKGACLLVRVSKEGWACPPGFVRVPAHREEPRWTAEFLSRVMERHGLKAEPRQMGNAFFLMGMLPGTAAAEECGEGAEGGVQEQAEKGVAESVPEEGAAARGPRGEAPPPLSGLEGGDGEEGESG